MRLWAGPQCALILLITHRDVQAAHKSAKYKKIKGYSVKEYYYVGYINIKMSYMS